MLALLKGGAYPDVKDNEGNTPLHVCKTLEKMTVLLQAGADPNAADASAADLDQLRSYSAFQRALAIDSDAAAGDAASGKHQGGNHKHHSKHRHKHRDR